MKYRRDIDGLRTVAVLPVVLNHAGVPGVSGGFVGVDIFFVISGFLITGILISEVDERRFSIVGFYERRARRILPALFFLLISTFAFSFLFLPPPLIDQVAKSAGATVLFVSNFWFYLDATDYFAADALTQPLLHTWSLAVEEQFYIVFPILLWILGSQRQSRTFAVISALAAISLVFSFYEVFRNQSFAFFLPYSRVWELGVGALLAFPMIRSPASQTSAEVFAAAGLVCVIGAIVGYDDHTLFPGLAATLPVAGAALLIWAGMRHRTFVSRILSARPFVGIGLISYSLYLWHWPVLVSLRLRLGQHDLPFEYITVAVAASLVLAWFSWRFIELPFRRRGPRGFGRGTIFGLSASGMVVLLAVAGLAVVSDGLRFLARPNVLAATDPDNLKRHYNDCSWSKGFCRLGADTDAPPEIVFWGDSHALALGGAFDRFAKAEGRSALLAAMNACAPLIGVFRADRANAMRCTEHNDQTMAFLRAAPSVRSVVLVGRWPLIVEGTRAPGEPGKQAVLRIIGETKEQSAEHGGAPQAFAHGLHTTVAALRELGLNVIIVGGVPEIGRSVPDGMALYMTLGSPYPWGPARSDTIERHAHANRIIARFLSPGQVEFVDPVALFCDQSCAIQRDDISLYRDDDHLSNFGADVLMDELLGPRLVRMNRMSESGVRP